MIMFCLGFIEIKLYFLSIYQITLGNTNHKHDKKQEIFLVTQIIKTRDNKELK